MHDFPGEGKAIPYGIYDLASNDGFVSVGVDHDTPVFAVKSIETWWTQVGQKRCHSRPPFLKFPTSSFFSVSTEITGTPCPMHSFALSLM